MSETTFRAVVAAVLVGALALAVVVTVVTLLPAPAPIPSPPVVPSASPSPRASPSATPIPGPVFETPGVVGVGRVARGSQSAAALVLEFVESRIDAIPDAPGSFVVTLTDRDGDGSTVGFSGTPSVSAPGSLGVTVGVAGNVLTIEIGASDQLNIEPITISGLGITANATAAVGPLALEFSGFSGSLSTGTTVGDPGSPGNVIQGP
jgi:hypothetical protein